MYVNVGAKYNADKTDIPTKKALKDEIRTNPKNVHFYPTSEFNGTIPDTLDMMDKGYKYQVTGPNPYNNRKWYATVEITPTGIIKVS